MLSGETIRNDVTGETLTMLESGGVRQLYAVRIPPHRPSPPLHYHVAFAETFTVMEGALDFYLGLYTDHVFIRYGAGIFILAAFGVYGWLLFSRQPRVSPSDKPEALETVEPNLPVLRQGHNLWLAGMWFGIFLLFGLAQWKVDMVDKQVWFVVPLAVCYAAVGATWAWQRFKMPVLFYGARLVIAGLILWTTYSAAALWFDRVFIKRR